MRCNDLRLVLAELIDGDRRLGDDDARDRRAEETIDTRDLLDWLTALVSELVEVKLADFPSIRDDGDPEDAATSLTEPSGPSAARRSARR